MPNWLQGLSRRSKSRPLKTIPNNATPVPKKIDALSGGQKVICSRINNVLTEERTEFAPQNVIYDLKRLSSESHNPRQNLYAYVSYWETEPTIKKAIDRCNQVTGLSLDSVNQTLPSDIPKLSLQDLFELKSILSDAMKRHPNVRGDETYDVSLGRNAQGSSATYNKQLEYKATPPQ